MRPGPPTRVALAIVMAAIVVALAIVASSSLAAPRTLTALSTSVVTSTTTLSTGVTDVVTSKLTVTQEVSTTNQPTTAATKPTTVQTSVSCTITGEGGPLYILVLTDLGAPVADQKVGLVHMGPSVNGESCGSRTLAPRFTNSTGWVQVPGGDGLPYAGSFYVSLNYSGRSYNATVSIEPVTTTYLTFYLPSGQYYVMNCQFNNCPMYSDSMMMDG